MYIRRPMCLLATGFLLLVYLTISIFKMIPEDYDLLSNVAEGSYLTVYGTVEKKQLTFSSPSVYLTDVTYISNNQKYKIQGIVLYLSDDSSYKEIKYGAYIKARGKFCRFDLPENEGQFNKRRYYYIIGYNGMLKKAEVEGMSRNYSKIRSLLYDLRERTGDIIENYCTDEEKSQILKALLLGDKTGIDENTRELYQDAGIGHILAISALHIAAIGMGILRIIRFVLRRLIWKLRRFNIPDKISDVISSTMATMLMILYCIMTGMSVSAMRALAMFALAMIADLLNRTYDLLSAAALSSIAVVIKNPLYVFDSGFLLSFSAVVSVGVIFPIFIRMAGCSSRFKIVKGLLASISIQLGTIPVIAYNYYKIALGSLLINLIVLPLMSLVLAIGTVIGVAGNLFWGFVMTGTALQAENTSWHNITCVIDRLLTAAGKVECYILVLYEKLADFSSDLPINTWIVGKPEMWQITLYYVLLAIAITLLTETGTKLMFRFVEVIYLRTVNIISIVTVFSSLFILSFHSYPDYVIRNLSVGQGDCSIITKSDKAIIIDCGSTSIKKVGKDRLVPVLMSNAITDIPLLCISHFDTDHVSGLIELLENRYYAKHTGCIAISRFVSEEYRLNSKSFSVERGYFDTPSDSENYDRIMELAKENGIRILTLNAGDIFELYGLNIECLGPVFNYSSEYDDANDASLVLKITDMKSEHVSIFTGDIGKKGESLMLNNLRTREKSADLMNHLKCNYLKVAHHGSKGSSSDEFLSAVFCGNSRGLSVISVGENNSYGHPHKETLDKLSDMGIEVYRTDELGEIMLLP